MGFNTVVGFMFSFFIIMGIIFFSFFTLIDDTKNKIELIEQTENLILENTQDFTLSAPYYGSGRVYFEITNEVDNPLTFKQGNEVCFDIFHNDVYVDKEDIYVSIAGSPASADYDFIEGKKKGTISIKADVNTSGSNEFKITSCEGIKRYTFLNSSQTSSYNDTFEKRLDISVTNTANDTISEYQVEIILNDSNFEFNVANEEDIRIVMPATEGYMLDLTFDDYQQTLIDSSKSNNEVFLGADTSSQSSDPLQLERGAISKGLSFEGDDYLYITANETLVINDSISFSFWINWDTSGDTTQTIIANGENRVNIVNDGGANDDEIEFMLNISGTMQTLYSSQTIDSNWHHIIAKYDGTNMSIYIDGVRENTAEHLGSITMNIEDNYIGYSGTADYLSGDLDEVKFVNYDLSDVEIADLYSNNHRFKNLDFYIATFDGSLKESIMFVKIPSIQPFKNVSFQIHYGTDEDLESASNIETTFSYTTPRLIGYVNHFRIADTTGLSLVSLYDDNVVYVGDNIITDFDEQEGVTISSGNTDYGSEVYVKKLVNIEGNGGGTDMISPIAWSGTEFAMGRPTNNPDNFCMLSPFGNSTYQIFDLGVEAARGYVNQSGFCRTDLNFASSDNTYINFSLPTLIYYSGAATGANDPFNMYPLTSGNYYFMASDRIDISAGASPITAIWYGGDGNDGVFNLNAFVDSARSGLGVDGAEEGMRLLALDPVGILKDDDGDGNDYVTIIPEMEMGTKFGSNEAIDYVVMVSPYSNANCSIYEFNNPIPLQTIEEGSGLNGVYNYSLGNPGTDSQFTGTRWKVECEKPAFTYSERANNGGDEMNLIGHLQIRQYIYPEPSIIIS